MIIVNAPSAPAPGQKSETGTHVQLLWIRPVFASPRHQGLLFGQGRIEHGLERVGKDAVDLANGGLQCPEDSGVREERDDWGDDQLCLREKRRKGAERVDIGRAASKADFLVRFSKLLTKEGRIRLADEKGMTGGETMGKSYSGIDEIVIGLIRFAAW